MREPDLRRCFETGLRIDGSGNRIGTLTLWEGFCRECPRLAAGLPTMPEPRPVWWLGTDTEAALRAWSAYWHVQVYASKVRRMVAPPLRELLAKGEITWFHLLV